MLSDHNQFGFISLSVQTKLKTMKVPKIVPWMSSISWGRVAAEFLSVLLAVFLAFLLNGWRQEQDHKKTADVALQGIVQEVQKNLRFLEYNQPLYDTLYQFMEHQAEMINEGKLSEEEIVFFKRGTELNMFPLNHYAWSAARETDAVRYMPFDQVQKLSHIYHIQELYNDLVEAFFMNIFNNMDFYTGEKPTILNMNQLLFRNLVQSGALLIREYQMLLEDPAIADTVGVESKM